MNTKMHENYMRKALAQARVAFKNGEVPIGAIVVDKDGNVLSRAYNKIEKQKCQAAHAEVIAIEKACKKIGGWRLDDCWMYVTLEPCLMCLGLIQLSRMKGIVFGVTSSLFGFGYGKTQSLPMYKKDLVITDGVLKNDCCEILKEFFQIARKRKKDSCEEKKRISKKD